MAKEFTFEIQKHIGTLSEFGSLTAELNLVSYSGAPAKYDLRKWRSIGGEKKMQKGITLTVAELRKLRDLLNSMEEI